MIRSKRRIRICTALLVLNLCFIWGNSLLPGEVSGTLSDWVKNFLRTHLIMAPEEQEGAGFLRKLAHFAEYALLGMCLSWLFGMLGKKKYWALVCGVLTACVDETIQRFVPDRGPSPVDVGIDTCGVLTGMILLFAGYHYWKKIKLKENKP